MHGVTICSGLHSRQALRAPIVNVVGDLAGHDHCYGLVDDMARHDEPLGRKRLGHDLSEEDTTNGVSRFGIATPSLAPRVGST